MSYFPTDIPFMSDEELIENGLKKPYKKPEIIDSKDLVPVRHGKWKKIGVWGRVYRCNQCGNFLDFDAVNAGRGDANFCPNCGADMRGKQDGSD